MEYRHEMKYHINRKDAYVLSQRLASLMEYDAHSNDAGYYVTSLYFDTVHLDAYRQKTDGIAEKGKFRIRIYNYDKDFIRLEWKRKRSQYVKKESNQITYEDYQEIMGRSARFESPAFLLDNRSPAIDAFLIEQKLNMLRPTVIVDYLRHVFVGTGDLRISFDFDLRVVANGTNLFGFNNHYLHVLPSDSVVMEVKYSSYLPAHIYAVLSGVESQYTGFSKYMLCMDKLMEVRYYA